MKRMIAILLAVLTMAAVLSGCGGRDGYNGNVSTTPNGRVNGGSNTAIDNGMTSGNTGVNGNSGTADNPGSNGTNGTNDPAQDRRPDDGKPMDDMREAVDDMGRAAKDAGRAIGDAITGDTGTGMTGGR